MGLIVRTAGLQRTKTEIKRDFDYLARLWDEIRERTLGSTAPALIYRDSDLIKRAIRDLYHREIEEVIVEGEDGYKAARGFMKLLMPSHVRRVKLHSETTPLFQRSGVEDQLNAMYQPIVQLKSGGYLVINPTEALVSIDINSGRSTREHNIEQTAFNTNLEAAQEIARQLRLRDMAGLIVIDFIDMEQSGHVRKVEKAMKEALKNDRARIQVGRISSFGLMEMSRQRLRTGVLEASTRPCPHCEGTGLMRTAASAGLSALRIIEDEAARGRGDKVCLRAGKDAAVYVLNKKRAELADIEHRYGVSVDIVIDESFEGARMTVESSGGRPVVPARTEEAPVEESEETLEISLEEEDEEIEASGEERSEEGDSERHGRRRRRRRRGGRGRGRRDAAETGSTGEADDEQPPSTGEADEQPTAIQDQSEETARAEGEVEAEPPARRRRRRRKGGEPAVSEEASRPVAPESSPMVERPIDEEPPVGETQPLEMPQPKPKRRRSKSQSPEQSAIELAPPEAPPAETAEDEAPAAKPSRARRSKSKVAEEPPEPSADKSVSVPAANNDTAAEQLAEPRRGWWQRTFG
jgi:ribonuclease E